jgi:predicted tellurium resistance membrane protein TerC
LPRTAPIMLDRLVYLSTGLAVVLAWIGVKLVLPWGHTLSDAVPEIPTLTSLAVILAILAVTTVASLVRSRRDPTARAHAGSLRAHPSRPDPESQPDTAKRP